MIVHHIHKEPAKSVQTPSVYNAPSRVERRGEISSVGPSSRRGEGRVPIHANTFLIPSLQILKFGKGTGYASEAT
jgi:hypothetical protein